MGERAGGRVYLSGAYCECCVCVCVYVSVSPKRCLFVSGLAVVCVYTHAWLSVVTSTLAPLICINSTSSCPQEEKEQQQPKSYKTECGRFKSCTAWLLQAIEQEHLPWGLFRTLCLLSDREFQMI